MIRHGMKVGEVFEDGGLYYEVQSVLPNSGYISKMIDEPKSKDKVLETKDKVEEVKYSKTDINRMPKDKLVELAKENRIEVDEDTSGMALKKALIEKFNL